MRSFVMAWRNLWRNRRRTLITMASVFFGVILSTIMTSMQEGVYSKMIDNVVKFYTGYLQVQDPDYWDNKTINNTFVPSDSLFALLGQTEGITEYVPRMESFTLISTGDETKGGALIGIDPEGENRVTGLKQWLDKGSYLEEDDNGILLTASLAENLEVDIGDTLVLLSQGYHGASAEGLFPLRGVLDFPSPEMNSMGGYVSLSRARDFFWAEDLATSVVVMLENYDKLEEVTGTLRSELGDDYAIITWVGMQPQVKQMIEADRAGALVMKAILYLLIGFGILGTIIMMLSERRREMGVMISIGMKKYRLIVVMIFETVMIGILGVIAGFLVSIPIISFLVNNPIPIPGEAGEAYSQFGLEPVIYFSSRLSVFSGQAITVLLITLAVAFYPALHTIRLKAVEALQS